MADRDLSLALRLYADSARFVTGLVAGERGMQRFTGTVRREADAFKQMMGTMQGQLVGLGVTWSAVAAGVQSAKMDKSLAQIGQTADASKDQVADLRNELFRMSTDTGQAVDSLQQSFNNAVQSGLAMREAKEVTEGTNIAMAVTGAAADRLAASVTVAATAFRFDLNQPGKALKLLDQMTVAGRLGNAELENLSDIFARVGVNAASGGMGFEQTLAFIEGLSMVERAPERLATLADSTLRLFTNMRYMKDAAGATGVKFFETNGSRRDPLAVLKDIKKEYDKLGTDKERGLFMQKAFGHADLDTIKGLRTLFSGDALNQIDGFAKQIAEAGGTLKRDLPGAIGNAVDQVGRLRTVLRKAADDFAQPINDMLAKGISFALANKADGGLGLDGKDMLLGGGALALGTMAAARYGGKAISGLLKGAGGTAAGVAQGKALEAAAGVTPVFVVNWPGSSGAADAVGSAAGAAAGGAAARVAGGAKSLAVLAGGLPASAWLGMGAKGAAMAGGGLAAAGVGGYAVGSMVINPLINALTSWATGRDETLGGLLYDLLHGGDKEQLEGKITIKVDQDGGVKAVTATAKNRGVDLSADSGKNMAGA